ncbi:MAG: ABC transporter permease, partial [OCS116 cluster bacterium]|nr:ABC transporter permease [OCS116 cluster bacterium]
MSNSQPILAKNLASTINQYPFILALVILAMLLGLNGFFEPNSIKFDSLTGLISTYLALMLLAIGQSYVVMAGDIDLSVGGIISLVNVSIVTFMHYYGGGIWGIFIALILGILVGGLCGLVNGFMVSVLRLQAIVATFATAILFMGMALLVMPVAGTPAPELFWITYIESYFGVPFVLYVLLGIILLIVIISKSLLVKQLLSVGDGALNAYQSGLSVTKIRVKGYMLTGVFCAFAAFCLTGDTASGDPLVGGKMTLYSIAALVLGGSAL